MGLGKTLQTLATILSTLDYAEHWLRSHVSLPRGLQRRTKATLVIVPSEGTPPNTWKLV